MVPVKGMSRGMITGVGLFVPMVRELNGRRTTSSTRLSSSTTQQREPSWASSRQIGRSCSTTTCPRSSRWDVSRGVGHIGRDDNAVEQFWINPFGEGCVAKRQIVRARRSVRDRSGLVVAEDRSQSRHQHQ